MPLSPFAELFSAMRQSSHTAIFDGNRSMKSRLTVLMSETPFEPLTTDNYFEQYDIPTVFVVGQLRERKRINRLRSQSIMECYAVEVDFPLIYVGCRVCKNLDGILYD